MHDQGFVTTVRCVKVCRTQLHYSLGAGTTKISNLVFVM